MASAGALYRIEAKQELLLKFVERQMEAGKWLLSSLLVVNGGAIVALLSNERFGAILLEKVGLYYATGAIFAFLCGVFSWGLSNAYFLSLRMSLGIKLYPAENLPSINGDKLFSFVWFVGMFLTGLLSLTSFSYATIEAALLFPIKSSVTSNSAILPQTTASAVTPRANEVQATQKSSKQAR